MNKRGAFILVICFFSLFTAFAIRYSYGILLPKMIPSLGISKTHAGVIYGSFFIAYTVFSPVMGFLADRIKIRFILFSFSAVLGIGTFLMAYPASHVEASIFFAIAGVGASYYSPVMVLAQRWISDKRRGIMLSAITAGGALGILITSLLMPMVVSLYSWRMGWKILGLLALVVGTMSFVAVRDYPRVQIDSHNTPLDGTEVSPIPARFVDAIRNGRFWLLGLSYLLLGFSVLVPFTFLTTYSVEEFAMPYKSATGLITVIAITSGIGRFFLGALSDAFGRIRLILISLSLIAIGTLGMVYQWGSLWLHFFALIFGCGHGAVWPLYAACASDYFSKRHVGTIIGMWTFLLGLGSMLCPAIAGWLADATGTLAWSFLLAGLTAIVSGLLLYPLNEKFTLTGSVKGR